MKILLLGANGQVGHELLKTLSPLGDVVAATRSGELGDGSPCLRVDLADRASLAQALDASAADVIVNAAAYTAVDRAEDEPALADRVNHLAPAEIGAWAAARGALVVHYSTDYVFDGGAKQPYREDDPTAPLGAYGRSKLAGENALRASGCVHLIFRTAWVYAARGGNFLRTMLRLGAEREELRIVADQVGAPTPATWIAQATVVALARWRDGGADARKVMQGITNVVARGQCTWFDFADAIFEGAVGEALLDHAPRRVPIATADYPTRAQRPAYSVLDTERLKNVFAIQLPDWRAGLDEILNEIARG
jgi:dTDP-4-dehydrorhamnose reductase